MTDLVPVLDGELVVDGGRHLAVPSQHQPGVDDQLDEAAWDLIAAAIPANTTRAYRRLLLGKVLTEPGEPERLAKGVWPELAWVPWCRTRGRRSGIDGAPATGETLAQWATELANASIGASTIEQGIAAVKRLHTEHRYEGDPQTHLARKVLVGYRANAGSRQVKRATPLTVPSLRMILRTPPPGPARATRDGLALVLGVAGMLRRSELAAMRLEHVTRSDRGLSLWLPTSKTDKGNRGATVAVPRGNDPLTDPLGYYERWLALLAEQGHDTTSGPLLRPITPRGDRIGAGTLHPEGIDIDRLIKAGAVRAGLGKAGWSGHSLRAGGATAAHLGGASLIEIMIQGRWTSADTVKKYIRFEELWTHNAAGRMGL